MKYCIHCGAEMPDEAEFCKNCGKSVDKATPAKTTGKKMLVIGIGVMLIIIITVVILFVAGVFKNNETGKVEESNEMFEEIFASTREGLSNKYEKQLLSAEDLGVQHLKGENVTGQSIYEVVGDKYLYIDNYKIQGLEGRLSVDYEYEDGKFTDEFNRIVWICDFPDGKTNNDYKDNINKIMDYFTILSGAPTIFNVDNLFTSNCIIDKDSDPFFLLLLLKVIFLYYIFFSYSVRFLLLEDPSLSR